MEKRLLALDVDGTLTNRSNQVTDATVAALRRAADAGILVALNTGRDWSEARPVLERIPEIRYLMGCTGAYLMDLQTRERLVEHPLKLELARQAYAAVAEYDAIISLYMDDDVYSEERYLREFTRFYPEALGSVVLAHRSVESLGAVLAARTADVDKYYLVFADPDERREAMERVKRLPVFATAAAFLDMEIMAREANKGGILLECAEMLGVDPARTVAVGDSENDIAMLQTAGIGVAMGNAKPKVQAAAGLVAPDNEHDGVAWVVEQMLRGAL